MYCHNVADMRSVLLYVQLYLYPATVWTDATEWGVAFVGGEIAAYCAPVSLGSRHVSGGLCGRSRLNKQM